MVIFEGLEAMTTCCGCVRILAVLVEKGVSNGLTVGEGLKASRLLMGYPGMNKKSDAPSISSGMSFTTLTVLSTSFKTYERNGSVA
jgi:hypothetical protein